jgi:hypothetical protein
LIDVDFEPEMGKGAFFTVDNIRLAWFVVNKSVFGQVGFDLSKMDFGEGLIGGAVIE